MKLFKCWVDAEEVKEETWRNQVDYVREGNVGSAPGEGSDGPNVGGDGDDKRENTKGGKKTAKDVKEKTTEQLAKAASQLQSL